MQLDALEKGDLPAVTPGLANGVADQLSRLKAAFARAE